MSDERPLAFVDIDGVVADVRHRLHHIERRPKDWDAFFAAAGDDPLHEEGAAIVATLARDHEVIFLTGRPRRIEQVTRRWLDANGFGEFRLLMPRGRDFRPAAVLKVATIRELAAGRRIGVMVDDDERVIDAVRAAGYPTFHAAWEGRDAEDQQALTEAQEVEGRT